jgi:hypothetical protein
MYAVTLTKELRHLANVLVYSLTSDMNVIQDGISDKVGLIIQNTVTFIAGFVVAFIRGLD